MPERRALVICAPSLVAVGNGPLAGVKLVRALLDAGWHVDVIGFRSKRHGRDEFFTKMVEGAGIHDRPGWFDKPSGWVPGAIRAGVDLLEHRSYDVILSIAHMTWTHVVARSLKRRSGLPWIAFFSDPWSNHTAAPVSAVRRAVERVLELRTYRGADAIVFTNPNLQEWMLGPFRHGDSLAAKSVSIPYFFDEALYPPPAGRNGSSKIVLRHIGTTPPGGYTEAFLAGLRWFVDRHPETASRLVVEFHGRARPNIPPMATQLGLDPYVDFQGHCSYPESLGLMRDTDHLLFLGLPADTLAGLGNATLHLKFCDYIGAGRPIFALADAGSPADDALSGTRCLCSAQDAASIGAALVRFLADPDLPAAGVRDAFSRDRVVVRWTQLMEAVMNGSPIPVDA